eukprot:904797-Pelagomonas_calceolata.AAC.2
MDNDLNELTPAHFQLEWCASRGTDHHCQEHVFQKKLTCSDCHSLTQACARAYTQTHCLLMHLFPQGLEAKHKGAVIVLSAHGDICTIGQCTDPDEVTPTKWLLTFLAVASAALTGAPIGTHFKNGLANCELRQVN